ncbi:MAG: ABC transporter permease [Betaproteobacteria bacterium]|jgi:simple sugar transport system permease protein
MVEFLTAWLAMVPVFATPFLLASLGLILSERAGVVSLGAEGYLATGAMVAAAAVILGGAHPFLALAAGAGAAAVQALGFGIVVVLFRADQVLAGLATVALGLGFTGLVGRGFVHETFAGLEPIELAPWSALPLVGPFLFRQDPLAWGAVGLALGCWWLLRHTGLGLRLRAVGEDPATADLSGVSVQGLRLAAVAAGGALCGLGGAYLSVAVSNVWVEGMVSGRGWIALALVIFARWDPLRAIAGAMLFGGVEALLPRLQAAGVDLPVYLTAMLPYLLTILVLVLVSLRPGRSSGEPAALGLPYVRQDRH